MYINIDTEESIMGKILVVEDDECIRTSLCQIIHSIDSKLEVFETGSAEKALSIAKANKIDAFILDIQLEDYAGDKLAEQLRKLERYKLTPVVFMSAAVAREFEAYRKIHCYSFIHKPVNWSELLEVLETLINYGIYKFEESLTLKLQNNSNLYKIRQLDIVYIERCNRKIIVKTIEEALSFSSYSLEEIMEQLSEAHIRCHRSYIVNQNFIQKIDIKNNIIYLHHLDTSVSIGRKFKDQVCKTFYKI